MRQQKRIYQDQTQYCDDGHENTGPLAQRHSVDLDKRLGGVQGKEGFQIRSAEQEEDRGEESHDSSGEGTG